MPESLIEAPAIEPKRRNTKNLFRKVGRIVTTPMVIGGLWLGAHSSFNQGENPRMEISTAAGASGKLNHHDVLLEQQTIATAKKHAADVKRWNVAVWNQAVWNNAIWWNEVNKPRIPYDPAVWERLHHCEQGDSWYANGQNPADPYHQTFQGGLGMSTKAWDMGVEAAAKRGVTLPDSALDASIDQQMQGAQAFYDATNGGGWGCPVG